MKLFFIFCMTLCIGLEAKRVYANMVADLFHYGHVCFLQQAAALGDELVVGIVQDALLEQYKRLPVIPQWQRVGVMRACIYVSEVIDGSPLVVDEAFMKCHNIDVVVHGSDFTEDKMKFYFPYAYATGAWAIVPYTPDISTTKIIQTMRERFACQIKYSFLGVEKDVAEWF